MKKILRSLLYTKAEEKLAAKENLGRTKTERFLSLTTAETNVVNYILDHYINHAEAPQDQLVYDHFEKAAAGEEIGLLDDVLQETFYDGASNQRLLENEVEVQAAQNLVATCKEAIKIAIQGVTNPVSKAIAKGTDDAVAHLFATLQGKPKGEDSKMKASMRKNAQALA